MKNTYIPKPVDTSDAVLPQELNTLATKLATQVHDIWAQGRIAEGWTYGETRDDAKKTNPCLVPFADLPESEQAYDLSTAYETLRLITKLEYQIIPPKQR